MYLARREFGKFDRVYPLKEISAARAWPFICVNPETGCNTEAAKRAGTRDGICATGYTRAQAVANLEVAHKAGIDEPYVFPEIAE